MGFRDLRRQDAATLIAGFALVLAAMIWMLRSADSIDRRLVAAWAIAFVGVTLAVLAAVRGYFIQPPTAFPKPWVWPLGVAMGAWVLWAATWPLSWSYPASDARSQPEVQVAAVIFFGFFGVYGLIVSLVVGLSVLRGRLPMGE